MSRVFSPSELGEAINRSRRLVPEALSALCDTITESTGESPDRSRVEYVSRFWLMHLCDQVTIESMENTAVMEGSVGTYGSESTSRGSVASRRSRLLMGLGSGDAPIVVVNPYLKSSLIGEIRGAIRLRKLARWMTIPTHSHSVCRRHRPLLSVGRDDASTIRRLVALTAPTELVEEHHEWIGWAKANIQPRLKVLYSANAHQSSLAFRHLAFEQRGIGTKVAIHQHGGGYGIDEAHLGEEHDIAMSDVFYTFGWRRAELGDRVRPLPTAMPQRSRRKPVGELLLMSLPVTKHGYRLQPFLLPHHIERAVDETVEFADELADSLNLRVRSSGSDAFPLERLQSSTARVVEGAGSERGSAAAPRAALVVHNYLGTSWLETLAMNIPTVCFYDPNLYQPRAAAQPFVDALARVGIIHYSGREAARFVNSLRGDPSAWWKSVEVQEAREAFVARYANFSVDWSDAWQDEFESLLAG